MSIFNLECVINIRIIVAFVSELRNVLVLTTGIDFPARYIEITTADLHEKSITSQREE